MDLIIRNEQASDAEAISAVHRAAFERDAEAELVERLREQREVTLSLVAVARGGVVGHLLFTPVTVGDRGAVGLGPISVAPELQGQGIGAALIREGLHQLRSRGHGAVVLLGSPAYYARFGFRAAADLGVRWEHAAPEGAFQALELRGGALADGGTARFAPPFG